MTREGFDSEVAAWAWILKNKETQPPEQTYHLIQLDGIPPGWQFARPDAL